MRKSGIAGIWLPISLQRSTLDRALQHRVTGTGKLTVDSPRREGGGIFRDVEARRRVQMERAQAGPDTMSI
jgi:hypothetical protein